MTSYFIAIIVLSFLFGWSLRTMIRILSPENGMSCKQLKVMHLQTARKAHLSLIIAGIAMMFFLPGFWLLLMASSLYGVIVSFSLSSMKNRLIREILILHEKEAILTLDLGHAYDDPNGITLKLWFKPGKTSWPLVELETGTSYISLPIEFTQSHILKEHFLPRLAVALKQEESEAIFIQMKNDLLAHGVTHPIDIKGWNHHPIIREMIERIMNAESQQGTHPQQPVRRAA